MSDERVVNTPHLLAVHAMYLQVEMEVERGATVTLCPQSSKRQDSSLQAIPLTPRQNSHPVLFLEANREESGTQPLASTPCSLPPHGNGMLSRRSRSSAWQDTISAIRFLVQAYVVGESA